MPVTSPPTGPAEWVAITFPGPMLGTGVATPLGELVEAKAVRVLDAVVVHKAAGFADAVRAHGGSVLAHDRVSPDDVARALADEVAAAPVHGSGA